MKLLMWHCSELKSRDIRRSTRPRGIRSLIGRPQTVKFANVLAAFVCVEEGDTAETTAAACEEILRLGRQIRRRKVVVVPFAHLSGNLMADSERAQELIALLGERLTEAGARVATNSFGYHKRFELHYVAKGHPGSVAFRDVMAGTPSARPDEPDVTAASS